MKPHFSRYHSHTMTAQPRTSIITIFRELGPAGLLGLAWVIVPMVAGLTLLGYLGTVAQWLDSLGTWGFVIYMLVFALTSGFGLLPTFAQAFLGGWVFGLALGIPAALVGFTGGAVIGYAIARVVSRDRVKALIARHAKARTIRDALIGRGFARTFGLVTLLRVPPNSPFALTNLLLSSCRIPLTIYIPSVILGMSPRTAIIVGFGAAASAQAAATGSTDIQSFLANSSNSYVLFGGLAVVIVLMILITRISNKALEQATSQPGH